MNSKPIVPNKNDIEEHKISAAMSYVGVLCFLPLFFKRKSTFVQWHAKQGLMLLLIEIISSAFGWLLWPIFLLAVFFSLYGISQVLHGKYWRLPFFGKYIDKLNL